MSKIISKVTIITLVFNNCELLYKAINSVKKQQVENVELEYIVLDDGSTNFDENTTQNMLNTMPCKTRLICNDHNIGTVKSFNKAIKSSSGDIIVPLSADDEFYDNKVLQSIIDEFNLTQELVVTGLRVPILHQVECEPLPSKKDRRAFSSPKNILLRIAQGNFISGASTYYHKDVFDAVGFFDERYRLLEDYPFYLKLLKDNRNIHFIEKKMVRYGMNGISTTSKPTEYLQNDLNNIYKTISDTVVLPFRIKRRAHYNALIAKERLDWINIIRYFDFFTIYLLSKLYKYINVRL
jgi:glycosyltransferase involved in cell wall biosynthesis